MRPKHSLDRQLTLKANGVHDLAGSITAKPAEEMRGERWDPRRAAQSRAFYPFVTCVYRKPHPENLIRVADVMESPKLTE
jgi:hypothetical protein